MRDPLRSHEVVPSSKTLQVGDKIVHPDYPNEVMAVVEIRGISTMLDFVPSHHGGEDDCDMMCRDGVWINRARIHTLAS